MSLETNKNRWKEKLTRVLDLLLQKKKKLIAPTHFKNFCYIVLALACIQKNMCLSNKIEY